MGDVAVRVENLSKRYEIGAAKRRYDTLRDQIMGSLKAAVSGNAHSRPERKTIWALKEVCFEIKRGEVIGIIGANGAGKSTLLKILSRVTEPTTGFAEIRGRVGSLLEVGTGFHPELTGRENIYLNGSILGMKKSEIDHKFDEIVAFSGVEKFIDMPVKRYSSGMYIRLAFAVAAHLEPELLIVDEVLAVGDADFQKKCLGKMENVATEGKTIIFVSHNMLAVSTLCSRVMFLGDGRIEQIGDTPSVIRSYMASATQSASERLEQVWDDFDTAPGNDKIRVRRIKIVPMSDHGAQIIDIKNPFRIEVEYWNLSPQNPLIVNLSFNNEQGVHVFGTISTTDPKWHGRLVPDGLFRSVCYIPGDLFNDGVYVMGLYFYASFGKLYEKPQAAVFTVHDLEPRPPIFYHKLGGAVRPKLRWDTSLLTGGRCG